MKQAYLSLVLPVPASADPVACFTELERIDATLSEQSRMHEIVVLGQDGVEWTEAWRDWSSDAQVAGPVSYVLGRDQAASKEDTMIEGLLRCVGDFVLEWEGSWTEVDGDLIAGLLQVSDEGNDVVFASPHRGTLNSRIFYGVANRYRTFGSPIASAVGTLYSRAAVDAIVDGRHAVKHRKVLAARSGLPSATFLTRSTRIGEVPAVRRMDEALDIALTGTRVGTRLTYLLAGLAALFGLATAGYAVVAAWFKGDAPEGWVTLMVVTGLGFSTVLFILALLGEMLSRVLREVQYAGRAAVTVQVVPPRRSGL